MTLFDILMPQAVQLAWAAALDHVEELDLEVLEEVYAHAGPLHTTRALIHAGLRDE